MEFDGLRVDAWVRVENLAEEWAQLELPPFPEWLGWMDEPDWQMAFEDPSEPMAYYERDFSLWERPRG
jgi:hypothetical protein